MRRLDEKIELNENWKPVLDRKADVLKNILPYTAVLPIYFLLLDLGFWFAPGLMHSPVLKVAGIAVSFLTSIFGWTFSFLTFGLLGGNFGFAKSVFHLFESSHFVMSILFVCLGFMPARIITGVLARAEISYNNSLKLLCSITAVTLIAVVMLCSLVENETGHAGKFWFVYLLAGTIYLFCAGRHAKKQEDDFFERKRKQPKSDYSIYDLKNIFRDLAD